MGRIWNKRFSIFARFKPRQSSLDAFSNRIVRDFDGSLFEGHARPKTRGEVVRIRYRRSAWDIGVAKSSQHGQIFEWQFSIRFKPINFIEISSVLCVFGRICAKLSGKFSLRERP